MGLAPSGHRFQFNYGLCDELDDGATDQSIFGTALGRGTVLASGRSLGAGIARFRCSASDVVDTIMALPPTDFCTHLNWPRLLEK